MSTGTTQKEESSISDTLFPWRHSVTPLDRVVKKDDLSGMPLTPQGRFVRTCLAARELSVSWISILLTQKWKDTLAHDCAWAFQKGVAGLLSKTFRVPLEDIDLDKDGIDMTTRGDNKNRAASWTEDQQALAETYVERMLDQDLQNLYKNVSSNESFLFKMKPIKYKLENAFVVPMLTRDMVRKNASLKGRYQQIEQEYSKSKDLSRVRQMAEDLGKSTQLSGMRTIICDVTIDCMETFKQESDNDEGQDDDALVTHLVRFEMVRSRLEKDPEKQLAEWKIIDWDDLLQGNVWH